MTNNLKSIKEEVGKLDYVHTEWGDCVHVGDAIKLLIQDRHAIGEMILEWVEKVEKESKKHPAIYFKRPDKSDGFNAGYASAFEQVKTFIKSELMNKGV